MNGRVNDGARTVHAVTPNRRTACAVPRRGHIYVARLTASPVTCKLCRRAAGRLSNSFVQDGTP